MPQIQKIATDWSDMFQYTVMDDGQIPPVGLSYNMDTFTDRIVSFLKIEKSEDQKKIKELYTKQFEAEQIRVASKIREVGSMKLDVPQKKKLTQAIVLASADALAMNLALVNQKNVEWNPELMAGVSIFGPFVDILKRTSVSVDRKAALQDRNMVTDTLLQV